jgi:hypothetical protein
LAAPSALSMANSSTLCRSSTLINWIRVLLMLEHLRDRPSGDVTRHVSRAVRLAIERSSGHSSPPLTHPLRIPGSQDEAGEFGHNRRGPLTLHHYRQMAAGASTPPRRRSRREGGRGRASASSSEGKTPWLATARRHGVCFRKIRRVSACLAWRRLFRLWLPASLHSPCLR